LSPELRTPLNAINGYLEIIRADLDKGCYDKLLRQRVENIARNTEILNRQVANLLDIGKLGGEDKYLNISEFNIGDFMRELLEYSVFCLQEKDITLVNHLSSKVPEKINTDRDVLSLILSTLIRALARVSRPGEVISCGCDAVEDKMIFWVRDNRRAEPYENLAELFQRMVPDADFSKTATPAVLNMMLASTKAVSLSAELNAASHEEAACEFTLTFNAWDIVNENLISAPGVHIISNHDDSIVDRDECVFEDYDRNYDSFAEFKLEAQLCSRNIEILLAEDDGDNAVILETLFDSDGGKVYVVSNGAQCRAALQEKDYDFLILSFFLPETDIFSLVKDIRRKKSPKELPIIILTGYLSQQDRQRLIVAGVNRCFIKPLNFQQLRRIVKAAVVS
jgi:CheY-like chemotaxis protein